jgi:hypothetical protein
VGRKCLSRKGRKKERKKNRTAAYNIDVCIIVIKKATGKAQDYFAAKVGRKLNIN